MTECRADSAQTPGTPGALIATYQYDARTYRIRKHVEGDANYDYYYNDSWQCVEERKNDSANPYVQYVWDLRYIDSPICRFRDEGCDGTVEETLYYLNDVNFNVTALVSPSSGNPVERYVYDPYGRPTIYNSDWSATIPWENSKKNEILFCGYVYDWERGDYHVRMRPFTPPLGRWRAPEHWLSYIDGANLYTYCSARPLDCADYLGLQPNVDTRSGLDEVNPAMKALFKSAADGDNIRGWMAYMLRDTLRSGIEGINTRPGESDLVRMDRLCRQRNGPGYHLRDGYQFFVLTGVGFLAGVSNPNDPTYQLAGGIGPTTAGELFVNRTFEPEDDPNFLIAKSQGYVRYIIPDNWDAMQLSPEVKTLTKGTRRWMPMLVRAHYTGQWTWMCMCGDDTDPDTEHDLTFEHDETIHRFTLGHDAFMYLNDYLIAENWLSILRHPNEHPGVPGVNTPPMPNYEGNLTIRLTDKLPAFFLKKKD